MGFLGLKEVSRKPQIGSCEQGLIQHDDPAMSRVREDDFEGQNVSWRVTFSCFMVIFHHSSMVTLVSSFSMVKSVKSHFFRRNVPAGEASYGPVSGVPVPLPARCRGGPDEDGFIDKK